MNDSEPGPFTLIILLLLTHTHDSSLNTIRVPFYIESNTYVSVIIGLVCNKYFQGRPNKEKITATFTGLPRNWL